MRHSDAIENWRNVFKSHPPFPFKDTMRNAEGRIPVLDSMAKLNLYFKHLSPATKDAYYGVRTLWLEIAQYIPYHRYTTAHREMTRYFAYKANYTPINCKTGESLV